MSIAAEGWVDRLVLSSVQEPAVEGCRLGCYIMMNMLASRSNCNHIQAPKHPNQEVHCSPAGVAYGGMSSSQK